MWVTAAAALWAVGLSVWLIPRQGAVGAAIAMCVAMAFSCVHAWFAGKQAYHLPFPGVPMAKVALGCCAMAALVLAVPGHGLSPFLLRVLLGGLGYATVAVLTNILDVRSALSRYVALRRAAGSV